MGNIIMSIVWLILLIIIGWPIAGFCAGFYILFLPFVPCFGDACSSITELLLKGVQLPLALGKGIKDGSSNVF